MHCILGKKNGRIIFFCILIDMYKKKMWVLLIIKILYCLGLIKKKIKLQQY